MKTGGNNIDIGAVEDHGGILTIRGGEARRSSQPILALKEDAA
jgi:hypothetical protein